MKNRILKILKLLLVLFTLALVLLGLAKFGIGIPCPIKQVTHLNCPSCGISRMILSLLSGDIKRAFYYNQILPFVLPIILIIFLRLIYRYIKYDNKELTKIEQIIVLILIILLLIYGILRNLYFYPFKI